MLTLPNGIGETAGDSLVVASPLQATGNVWYVQSTTGSDAASPAGRDKQAPLATLQQAITNAVAGDIIVLLPAHVQTVVAPITVSKRLVIVGAGFASGKPTATLNTNTAGAAMLNLTADGVELRNIYFPSALSNTTLHTISVNANYCRLVGCYFESGIQDIQSAGKVSLGSVGIVGTRFTNCTFISVGTAVASRPTCGLSIGAATQTVALEGCVFDDGTFGYSVAAFNNSAALTMLSVEGCSLLRGADFLVNASTVGYANFATVSGGGRATW